MRVCVLYCGVLPFVLVICGASLGCACMSRVDDRRCMMLLVSFMSAQSYDESMSDDAEAMMDDDTALASSLSSERSDDDEPSVATDADSRLMLFAFDNDAADVDVDENVGSVNDTSDDSCDADSDAEDDDCADANDAVMCRM